MTKRVAARREPVGTRGDERSRMITFDSDSLTVMVSLHENPGGTMRLDGWLSPAGSHPVELRAGTRSMTTMSDDNGRFVIDHIPRGAVQLFIRPAGRDITISTPVVDF